MNIKQLIYIVEVAKVKSLGEAARTLNISQSAVSQTITKFEAELDIKIFNRTRGWYCTNKRRGSHNNSKISKGIKSYLSD